MRPLLKPNAKPRILNNLDQRSVTSVLYSGNESLGQERCMERCYSISFSEAAVDLHVRRWNNANSSLLMTSKALTCLSHKIIK